MILVPDLVEIERHATSNAERLVARLLRGVDTDAEAVAFHSVKLRSHPYKQQAEADFVILYKGVVFVLEVKGGGVRRHEGSWYSIDRRGDWHRLNSSPIEQAQSAAFALRDILREENIGWFAHEAIVATPDIEAPPPSVEWRGSHWLSKNQMSSEKLAEALDAVAADRRRTPTNQKVASHEALRVRLFGEFTRVPVIDAQRGAVIEEQNRATMGQARVLAALARNPRILVLGGAGTGKSIVLAEAAKQEADQGRSVLVTFGSPGLIEFFRPRVADRHIDLIPFGSLAESQKYDVIFVDEAQDLMNADGMDRLDGALKGGRASGRWRMFLDPNNQAHVDGEFDPEVYSLIAEEASSLDLDLNVRNTRAIVHIVQEYLGADVGDPGIVHGERVRWHMTGAEGGLLEAEKVAGSLVSEGVNRSDVWIIRTDSAEAPILTDSKFLLTSPRYAKGLEAEHVVVCGLANELDASGVAALYVAVTRARVSLTIVASKEERRKLQTLLKSRLES